MSRIFHGIWHRVLNKWCSVYVSWTKLAKPIVLNVKKWRNNKTLTKSFAFRVQLMKVQASWQYELWDRTTSASIESHASGRCVAPNYYVRVQLLAGQQCETAWRIPLYSLITEDEQSRQKQHSGGKNGLCEIKNWLESCEWETVIQKKKPWQENYWKSVRLCPRRGTQSY